MQWTFDFWNVLELLCVIAFLYRGVQDILGKGKPKEKDREEYEALHVFSGITLISLGIAALVQMFFSQIVLLYALTFGAAVVCSFVYLVCLLSYRGSRDETDK